MSWRELLRNFWKLGEMKENLSFQILSSQHCINIELEDNVGQCLSDLRMKEGFNKPKIMKGNYKRKVGFKIL